MEKKKWQIDEEGWCFLMTKKGKKRGMHLKNIAKIMHYIYIYIYIYVFIYIYIIYIYILR